MTHERFELVLPTSDPTLIPLQLARDGLEPLGGVYMLNGRTFDTTFDKNHDARARPGQQLAVASGQIVSGAENVSAALEGRSYPLVITPQSSDNRDDLEIRKSTARVFDEEETRRAISDRLKRGLILVEEDVVGIGWGIEVLAANGQFLLSQQHERLHEPLHGDQSSYRRTVRCDPAFMEAVVRLVRELDYTGVAVFEFKGDPRGEAWPLIEINGCFWESLPLSLAAGIEFPYAPWQLLVDGPIEFANRYRTVSTVATSSGT